MMTAARSQPAADFPPLRIKSGTKKLPRALRKGLRLVLVQTEPGVARITLSIRRGTARKLWLARPARGG